MRSSFPETEGSDPGRAVQRDDICELHPGCLPVGGPNSAGPLNRGFNPPNKRGEMVLLSISGRSLGSAHLRSDYLNAICSLARGERGHGQVIAADPDHTQATGNCWWAIRGTQRDAPHRRRVRGLIQPPPRTPFTFW